MKLKIGGVLMIPLLFLAGCGAREAGLEAAFDGLRTELLAAEQVSFTAGIRADRGETAEEYTLAVRWDGQTTEMEVLAPELIAGIRASVKWGESAVSYENVLLDAGPLEDTGVTPVSAAPAILAALAGGHLELRWWDGDRPAARYYAGEDAACTVWLDPDTGAPAAAEISAHGRRVIACVITDWTLTAGAD